MTRDQAVALYKSRFWDEMDDQQRASFQLFEDRLCMPFDVFHAAVEKVLGRSVWTHEFAGVAALRREFLGEREAPTFAEIVALIPADKRVLIATDEGR